VPEVELRAIERAAEEARAAEQQFRDARRGLREAMRAAHEAGDSLTAIGRAAGGISRQRVRQILEEE